MTVTRRGFLRAGLALPAVATCQSWAAADASGSGLQRNLVFVELMGGNDGLNTVVPHSLDDGAYRRMRPKLAVPRARLLDLTPELALHPACAPLHRHYEAGDLTVLVGIGYPDSSMSHAVAQTAWNSGDPSGQEPTGWLARHLVATQRDHGAPRAYRLYENVDELLNHPGLAVAAADRLDLAEFPIDPRYPEDRDAIRQAYLDLARAAQRGDGLVANIGHAAEQMERFLDTLRDLPPYRAVGEYPTGGLGHGLPMVMRLLAADVGLRYHQVVLPGFDTHAGQDAGDHHANLLGHLAQSLDAFQTDLKASGLDESTLVVVYSEFGRSAFENGSGGTDHGTAGVAFVLGAGGRGGVQSPHPPLANDALTADREMHVTVDYRDLFGTLIDGWVGGDASGLFPGHRVRRLPLLG